MPMLLAVTMEIVSSSVTLVLVLGLDGPAMVSTVVVLMGMLLVALMVMLALDDAASSRPPSSPPPVDCARTRTREEGRECRILRCRRRGDTGSPSRTETRALRLR